jgi:hypothetical protein
LTAGVVLQHTAHHRAGKGAGRRANDCGRRNVSKGSTRVTFTLVLDVTALLRGEQWTAPSKAYLQAQGDEIPLRKPIDEYAMEIYKLYTWLFDQPDGAAFSCASEPGVVAMMLDQLDIRPGQHVLEIGAGTGYNAAVLAHLTGPDRQVSTVDIDPASPPTPSRTRCSCAASCPCSAMTANATATSTPTSRSACTGTTTNPSTPLPWAAASSNPKPPPGPP